MGAYLDQFKIWANYYCKKCGSAWHKHYNYGGWDNRPKMKCPGCDNIVKAHSYEQA